MTKKSNFFKCSSVFVVSLVACLVIYNNAFAECAGTETVLINCDVGGDGGIFYIIRIVMETLLAGVGIPSIGESVPNGKKLVFKGTNQRNQTILIW